ncbi:MAG TPA: YggS family pyridoxal phosphate-dependent enzyme [Acidimicrobiia bacterium]|nr:YggS family pyridoxal phosphate-dependent enzyme [Acidimicrobiia bacterium]
MSYQEVVSRAASAAERAGRTPDSVTLVAVSKSKPISDIEAVYQMGHRDFGENRAQEMAEKATGLPGDIRWHFVGGLQANKARMVRPITHLLHSMDRESLAAAWAKGNGLPPPVLLQVNTGREPQKSGVMPERARETLERIVELGLEVRGLMAIPPISDDPEAQRPHFALLRHLRDDLSRDHPGIEELSMGMTDDFEVAVEEGSSIIRVGRAIFGERT